MYAPPSLPPSLDLRYKTISLRGRGVHPALRRPVCKRIACQHAAMPAALALIPGEIYVMYAHNLPNIS